MYIACRSVTRRKSGTVVKLRTPEDGNVCIHPRSINEKESEFESPFLLYHLKLKSTSIYLHDTTMVYPLPLLFFGRGVDVCMEGGLETIAVDKSIRFKCQESTANLVKVSRIYGSNRDKKAACQKISFYGIYFISFRNWEQGWTSSWSIRSVILGVWTGTVTALKGQFSGKAYIFVQIY